MRRVWQYICALFANMKHEFERRDVEGNVVLALVAVGVPILGALGIVLPATKELKHIAEVSLGVWAIWFLLLYGPYRLWVSERAKVEAFELLAVPKIEVEGPIYVTEPKDAKGRAFRTWRLRVGNISTTPLTNCYVKMAHLINAHQADSRNIGVRFKLTTDKPKQLSDFPYRQSFDLAPNAYEDVDIVAADENVGAPNLLLYMLYAIPGSSQSEIHGQIPSAAGPYQLVIHVHANEIIKPLKIEYRIDITELGTVRMTRI